MVIIALSLFPPFNFRRKITNSPAYDTKCNSKENAYIADYGSSYNEPYVESSLIVAI
jgi:hypothetical protein